MDTSDRIEKRVSIRAPISRVWHAISDAREFSCWFGIQLQGEFVAGARVTGTFGGQFNEAAIMEHQKKLGLTPSRIRVPEKNLVFCTVERIEPPRYFSFRWIPYGIDAEADPEAEPTTLVEFFLEAAGEGTVLTVVESGFDRVPAHRRERAFRMDEAGWAAQVENIRRHADGA
ncbi:MAG TPA: SRPBCC family protein [Steroidobacteraceae bacterium]|nr:SRPBCC family protein [Steroidobacteraceae bacterium]